MKTIGIIGGVSWVSSQKYYQLINELVNLRCGRQASAEILLKSINFQKIIDHQVRGEWNAANQIMVDAGQALQTAGADCFMIASNTMHTAFGNVASNIRIPGINIFAAISESLKEIGISKVGLIGTRYTMTLPFFKDAYRGHGITAVTPDADGVKTINSIIFKNLIQNNWNPSLRTRIDKCIEQLTRESEVTAIVLGCTELELLYPEFQKKCGDEYGWIEHKSGIKLIDSTRIHALASVRFAFD